MEKAKAMLKSGNYGNCVLYSNGLIHTSSGKGISPMLEFLNAGLNMKNFSAADTVAGKAAALFFALAEVNAVYADIMSRSAVEVFKRFNIRNVHGELVEKIQNRTGTGVCPMEQAVENIDEPKEAFEILKKKLAELRKT